MVVSVPQRIGFQLLFLQHHLDFIVLWHLHVGRYQTLLTQEGLEVLRLNALQKLWILIYHHLLDLFLAWYDPASVVKVDLNEMRWCLFD